MGRRGQVGTSTGTRTSTRYWRLPCLPCLCRNECDITLLPPLDLEELVCREEDEHSAFVDSGVCNVGILADIVNKRVLRVGGAAAARRR